MRIVVTRADAQAEELVSAIEELGHQAVRCPLIRVEPLADEPIDPSGYDWVVVTSRTGAAELARRARGRFAQVAAIGPGTAEELDAAGIPVALVPRVSTQEGLLAELPRPAGRVLFAGAAAARPLLAEELGADVVPLYRTVALRPAIPDDAALVVLASASAARALAALRLDLPVVSIGPQTPGAARAAGLRVVAEAVTHDLDGLVAAVSGSAV